MTTTQISEIPAFTAALRMESARASVAREGPSATEEAFHEMVETYSSLAYNVAFRMLHNAQDAEDAVQDAFLSAYRALSSFKGQSKVSTWLYRIVVNACLMKIRKEKASARNMVQTTYDDAIVHDRGPEPESLALSQEFHRTLGVGLGRLAPDLRVAIVLKDVQELSNGEGAGALSISVSAFKSRVHRGRLLLREYLTDVGRADRS